MVFEHQSDFHRAVVASERLPVPPLLLVLLLLLLLLRFAPLQSLRGLLLLLPCCYTHTAAAMVTYIIMSTRSAVAIVIIAIAVAIIVIIISITAMTIAIAIVTVIHVGIATAVSAVNDSSNTIRFLVLSLLPDYHYYYD